MRSCAEGLSRCSTSLLYDIAPIYGDPSIRTSDGHRQRAAFVGFKRDLRRQHHIASDEVALRNEAPFSARRFNRLLVHVELIKRR
jgi:hypothetical protein